MRFTKMHGTGNDYIYVNAFKEVVQDPSSLARQLSNRHFGVGSDGLVLIMPSVVADFRMRMFNADGSESEMCGNASRCIGKYVYDKGLTKKNHVTLETAAGIKELGLMINDGKVETVTVNMGAPILDPIKIPVLVDGMVALHVPLVLPTGEVEVSCVSMGNPHAVCFVDDVEALDMATMGPAIELHPLFPNRVNAEFVQVLAPDHLKMRVWERGAGETLACGTGACATLVAAVMRGLAVREAKVDLRGGSLQIHWQPDSGTVLLTGEAAFVFEGETI